MKFTTVTTSKGQLTIPKQVRDKLGLTMGIKIDIYPTEEGFIGRVHKKSQILSFVGDLKHMDDGASFEEIREKAQVEAARVRTKNI